MKIDVIIPCYKAHKTLPRLLGSILSQTILEDLKITLVNDGDEKDYQEIIKPFKNFMDIQELKLEKNSGPGTARRYGYENTNNPYVIWADADDTFYGAFALQELRYLIKNENTSISVGNFLEEETVIINPEDIKIELHRNDLIWIFGKLYKRAFLDKFDIKMNNTRSNEDNGFNTLCKILSSEVDKIQFVNNPVYLWHSTENSITRIDNCDYTYNASFKGYVDNMLWVFEELKRIEKTHNLEAFQERIIYEKIHILINLYSYYIETLGLEPKYAKQNLEHSKRYYNQVYKSIENEIPKEMFEMVWHEVIEGAFVENRFNNFIPAISIFDFLNQLKQK